MKLYAIAHQFKEDTYYDRILKEETELLDVDSLLLAKEIAEKVIEDHSLSEYMVVEFDVCPLCNQIEDDCWCGNQN
ncbi:hypothetical protein PDQ07_15115 [Bacillus cereus]|nr:hypothetical protein [Bacillus cereus]